MIITQHIRYQSLEISKSFTLFPQKLAESWEGEGAQDAAVPDPDNSRHPGTCRPAGVYCCFVVLLFCFVFLLTRVFLGQHLDHPARGGQLIVIFVVVDSDFDDIVALKCCTRLAS